MGEIRKETFFEIFEGVMKPKFCVLNSLVKISTSYLRIVRLKLKQS
jgi:hypothetical protein